MSNSSIKNRIDAIKRDLEKPLDLPKSICKLTDGTVTQFIGLNVVQPFLDGKITDVVCDDANIAQMLRAMDTEKTTKIEIVEQQHGDRLIRTEI